MTPPVDVLAPVPPPGQVILRPHLRPAHFCHLARPLLPSRASGRSLVAHLGLGQFPCGPGPGCQGLPVLFLVLSPVWYPIPFLGPVGEPVPFQGPSSTHSGLTQSSSKQSRVSSHCSSSSQRLQDCYLWHSRARSPAQVQASSSSVVPFAVESCSPLDSVPVSYLSRI